MNDRTPDTAATKLAAAGGASCVAGALAAAVFYHGPQIPLLAGAQALLVFWVVLSLLASYPGGVRIPLTPVSTTLTLFWLWLALSLAWSTVPVTSTFNFWWVGSVATAFWAYTLAPARDRIWGYVSRFALIGAAALCAYALVQLFVWREPPRSVFVNIHSFGALMMLVALPLAAFWLIAWRRRAPRLLYLLGAALFLLFFSIAATEGRGTALSLLLGTAVLAALAFRAVGARPLLVMAGLLVGAYTLANLFLHGGFVEGRLTTLVDPASAAAPRLLIWRGSWQLLMDNPWWGIGLGTYYLAWPPYRDPADTTLGFFVHNDYLQLWIEAGLPALLLLVGVYVAVLLALVRWLRQDHPAPEARLEALGLFAGLFAVAAHSFVDFNFYILPISLGAGLALGRFHELTAAGPPLKEYVWRPEQSVQVRAYRLIVVLLALFPMSYFVALGASDYLYKRGFVLAAEGRLPEADNAFVWAERLLPGDDKVLVMHADLYRHVLARLPRHVEAERRSLYAAALDLLEEAEAANPYRAMIHGVRARLLEENPDLAGAGWEGRAEAAYRTALARDPRAFQARMSYAGLLLRTGREAAAARVLEEGLEHWYYPSEAALAYYEMAAQVARRIGRAQQAAAIERRAAVMREAIATLVAARPVVADLTPATAASAP